MDEISDIFLRRLAGRLAIACQVTGFQFATLQQESWCPAINAYRCRDGFVICVDLAGVEQTDVRLTVEPSRIWIRGRRLAPEPDPEERPALQVLALEIDHGDFEREIFLPEEVEPASVQAEQRNGMLWIDLFLRVPS